MNRRHLTLVLFICLLSVSTLHIAALEFQWYWFFKWLDVPMHLLGGFTLGVLSLFAYSVLLNQEIATSNIVALAVIASLVGGVSWEIFEAAFDVTADAGLRADTIKDIAVDLTGGLVAGVWSRDYFFVPTRKIESINKKSERI